VDRAELQRLARDRLRDAKALLAAKRWSGAYSLAGYAVECALKACVIAYLMKTDQFPDKRFSEQCWTHNLVQLLGLAGLKTALEADMAADAELDFAWGEVKNWSEASRYRRTPKARAVRLFRAIAAPKHGVFRWIKSHW
jgi:HEPN domain-containing protein